MNKKFASLGTAISRDEAKKIIGGLLEGGGTCCAHNGDWSYQSCGISQQEAQNRADQYASGSGQRGYWCCSSCNQQPV